MATFHMEKISTPLDGAFLIRPPLFEDNRGSFVKTFHRDQFANFGVEPIFHEEFYSTSHVGVIRGMHFQVPPKSHAKYVCCLAGVVRDVILDLRVESRTYGKCFSVELSADNRLGMYIPAGLAHGFLSLTPGSLMLYKTTATYSPEVDAGISWDSFGFEWGIANPLISRRDAMFPRLADFVSPFVRVER